MREYYDSVKSGVIIVAKYKTYYYKTEYILYKIWYFILLFCKNML